MPFAEGASEFEIQTATAILCFAEEGCEYAVIECGMGGLNDATNAVENKALAVITSVSLEHTAFLGKTVKEICVQKSGIIKNCPVIVNAHQSAEAREFFRGCKFADDVDEVFDGGFIYGGKKFELNAEGCCQHLNAACAIEGAKILGIDDGAVYKGVADCRPRGRLEKFYLNGREYILDGAHNPDGMNGFLKSVHSYFGKKEKIAVMGVFADKDYREMAGMIGRTFSHIYTVAPPSERALAAEELASALNACARRGAGEMDGEDARREAAGTGAVNAERGGTGTEMADAEREAAGMKVANAERVLNRAVACGTLAEAFDLAKQHREAVIFVFGSLSLLKGVYDYWD